MLRRLGVGQLRPPGERRRVCSAHLAAGGGDAGTPGRRCA